MYTRSSLMSFLKEISEEAQFETFNFDSPEQFNVIVKCKVEDGRSMDFYNKYAKNWINTFSTFTSTAWIYTNTSHSIANRIAFKKSYLCHRSSQNKSKRMLTSVFCHAKVDFKTKFINKYTMRNDEYLLKGLNMTIKIHFVHTHVIHDLASFSLLRSSKETDAVFYEYFEEGHSATSAKCYHELVLLEEYGRDCAELTNANLNPTLRHITYLHDRRWGQSAVDVSIVMQKKMMALEKLGHTVKYTASPQFAVVLTATMKQVIQRLPMEQVLVDEIVMSSGVSLMFFFIPTEIGSLPIASVVYMKQNDTYSEIFFALKLTIECECNRTFQPKLLVLGNLKSKDTWIQIFPEVIVKKNRFTLCREFWEWICDDNSGIEHRMTQREIMVKLKSAIYAKSIADALGIFNTYLTDSKMERCLDKLKEIWSQRNYWLVEESCRDLENAFPVVLRECVMRRCQSFNMCAMVDFVTNILEKQYKRITLCHVMEGDIKEAYTKLLPRVKITSSMLRQLNPNEYLLQASETIGIKSMRFYHLNVDSMCCDCKEGMKGRFCEHLCGAVHCVENGLIKAISPSEDVKSIFLNLVESKDAVMKDENQSNFIGCSEASDDSSTDDFIVEIKQEVPDPLEEPMADASDGPQMSAQYEASMKALNDEFRRLDKLFKDNPNAYNLETIKSLTNELSKIRPGPMVEASSCEIKKENT